MRLSAAHPPRTEPSCCWGGCSPQAAAGSPVVPCPASGSRMGLSRVKGGTESGSSQCRGSSVGSLSRTCSREKIQQREDVGRALHIYNTQTPGKTFNSSSPGFTHITGKCFAKLSCSGWKFCKIYIFTNHFCYAKGHEIVNTQCSQHGWRRQQTGPFSTAERRQGSELQERRAMPSHIKKQKNSSSIFRAHFGEHIFKKSPFVFLKEPEAEIFI